MVLVLLGAPAPADLVGEAGVVAGEVVGVGGEADDVAVLVPGALSGGELAVFAGGEAGVEGVDLGAFGGPDGGVEDVDGAAEAFVEVGAGVGEDAGRPRLDGEQDDAEGLDAAVAGGDRSAQQRGDAVDGVAVAAGGDEEPAGAS